MGEFCINYPECQSFSDIDDKYIFENYCKYCELFICEGCQTFPEGYFNQEQDEIVCPQCLFENNLKILDKDYLKDYISAIEEKNLDLILQRFICDHIKNRIEIETLKDRNFNFLEHSMNEVPSNEEFDKYCVLCNLNSCIYGYNYELYLEYIKTKIN